jgi:tRNA N6-adenosine threonylcarbamoyltransferase
MRLLAIETSCDDTCAAVVEDEKIRSSVISSQAAFHERFGGVVPEVAARHHLQLVNGVVEAALGEAETTLDDVDAIAVTRGPGLIGALLVGVSAAKALAAPRRIPLIAVDHLHGHVAANFLAPDPIAPPFLCLIASGGHTLLAGVREHGRYDVLGQTLDDAAGEAFDKGARLLGLGYPGGPALQRLAENGDPAAFDFPVAMTRDPGLDFSFSGLKTALVYRVREMEEARRSFDSRPARSGLGTVWGPSMDPHTRLRRPRADLAASYQEAIVAQLLAKLGRALDADPEWKAVAIGGGVAANGPLRDRVASLCEERGLDLKLVPLELCTDNAAMIASAARFVPAVEYPEYLSFDAFATGPPRLDTVAA